MPFQIIMEAIMITVPKISEFIFDKDQSSNKSINQFLNVLATTEQSDWKEKVAELPSLFPSIMAETSICKVLNLLNPSVLKSDNLELISLFKRALINHNELSAEKADPFQSYYKHYQPPSFLIPDINLTLEVDEKKVFVTSELTVRRNSKEASLILDGVDHEVLTVYINDEKLPKDRYRYTTNELIILGIPEEASFKVKINSIIDPFTNTELIGLYVSGKHLTTQCEAEGARCIFFTLDRPDVLSRITTTIIADKAAYPYRLSNGNLESESTLKNGLTTITWVDPIPKPSYLFACVMGDFSKVKDSFITLTGKKVDLEVYVEKGKESRAKYSLFALKKAMFFDEAFFDRVYDLTCMKMVAMPEFNAGAMENKGLMIFNETSLLIDSNSGTDADFRHVAETVAHEYFHNWSGNRVTVRNWFELALKEAFTDFRASLFSEWLFGEEFIRPKDVIFLRERQFPEEASEDGHPIMVESYVNARSIYDYTTYIKGREVFRTLSNYTNLILPGGFRKVQNLYFSRHDGKAVTFKELLKAANDVLKTTTHKDLAHFERWFNQPGTPVVHVSMDYNPDKNIVHLTVKQSCPHPKTGEEQKPLPIPFSYELLKNDGSVIHPKVSQIIHDEEEVMAVHSDSKPIPIFMHGFSAPVILKYDYTLEELACIVKHTNDPYNRWEASQNYSLLAMKEAMKRITSNSKKSQVDEEMEKCEYDFSDLQQLYVDVLESPKLSPLAKAQLLQLPSIRSMAQNFELDYDFTLLNKVRTQFIEALALKCSKQLHQILIDYPRTDEYKPDTKQMQIRELLNLSLSLLAKVNSNFHTIAYAQFKDADNFNDHMEAFKILINVDNKFKKNVIKDFYDQWKDDKAVFNHWLSSQASSSVCTVKDLVALESVAGYDPKNPNHIRSIVRSFILNPSRYHDPKGEGYDYVVDKIIEVGKFNHAVAHGYLAQEAFVDFDKLPEDQRAMMATTLVRLQEVSIPLEIRDLANRMLEKYDGYFMG